MTRTSLSCPGAVDTGEEEEARHVRPDANKVSSGGISSATHPVAARPARSRRRSRRPPANVQQRPTGRLGGLGGSSWRAVPPRAGRGPRRRPLVERVFCRHAEAAPPPRRPATAARSRMISTARCGRDMYCSAATKAAGSLPATANDAGSSCSRPAARRAAAADTAPRAPPPPGARVTGRGHRDPDGTAGGARSIAVRHALRRSYGTHGPHRRHGPRTPRRTATPSGRLMTRSSGHPRRAQHPIA